MMPYKIAFVSLGCAKNLVNTEQMMALVRSAGHEITAQPEGADAAVLNTCGFIDSAKSEAIQNILELAELKKEGKLGKLLVKRVVGLPGDEITFQDGYTYINGEMLDESYLPRQGITQCSDSFLVPEGCVFFMGDNRTGSNDARFWKQPYISVDNIRAKVMVGISALPDNSWRGVRVIH